MRQYDDPRIPAVYGEAELKRMIDEIKASQDALREDRKRLLEENEKLKYLNRVLKGDNAKLEEDNAGWQQTYAMALNIMECIIEPLVPTQDNPLCVLQETINRHFERGTKVVVDYDAETKMWKMYLKEEQGEE